MGDAPITWQTFAAAVGGLITLLCAIGALASYIAREFNRTREASEEGRRRLYEKVDSAMAEVRQTFLPRDLFDAERRRLDHTSEELSRQVNALAERINSPCPMAGRRD